MAIKRFSAGDIADKIVRVGFLRDLADTLRSVQQAKGRLPTGFLEKNRDGQLDSNNNVLLAKPALPALEPNKYLYWNNDAGVFELRETPPSLRPDAPVRLRLSYASLTKVLTATFEAQNAPSGASNYGFNWYLAYQGTVLETGSIVRSSGTSTVYILNENFTNGETYEFGVAATLNGAESEFTTATFTVSGTHRNPSNAQAPTDVSVRTIVQFGADSVIATWTGHFANQIYDYFLTPVDDPSDVRFSDSTLGRTGGNQSFSITRRNVNLSGYTSFIFFVRGRNSRPETQFNRSVYVSARFNTAQSIPSAPTGLNVSYDIGSTTLNANWNHLSDAGSYDVSLAAVGSPSNTLLFTAEVSTNSFSRVVQLTQGQQYIFGVRGKNSAGTSEFTTETFTVPVAQKLSTPTGISFRGTTLSLTRVDWNPVPNANYYEITANGNTVRANNNFTIISGLEEGTTYNVSIVAKSNTPILYSDSDAGTASFTTLRRPDLLGVDGIMTDWNSLTERLSVIWDDLTGATSYGYNIQSADGPFASGTITRSELFIDAEFVIGTTYQITIWGIDDRGGGVRRTVSYVARRTVAPAPIFVEAGITFGLRGFLSFSTSVINVIGRYPVGNNQDGVHIRWFITDSSRTVAQSGDQYTLRSPTDRVSGDTFTVRFSFNFESNTRYTFNMAYVDNIGNIGAYGSQEFTSPTLNQNIDISDERDPIEVDYIRQGPSIAADLIVDRITGSVHRAGSIYQWDISTNDAGQIFEGTFPATQSSAGISAFTFENVSLASNIEHTLSLIHI